MTSQLDSENRQLKKIIAGFVTAIIVIILGLGITLYTLIPAQKDRNFLYYGRQLGLIIVSQVSRLFPKAYAQSDSWRDRATWFVKMWNDLMNAITTGTQTRREGDTGK